MAGRHPWRGRVRARPSRASSILAMVAGLFLIGFTLLVIVPQAGPFGLFFTFVAAMIAASGAVGAFGPRGLADRVIEVETEGRPGPEAADFEADLRRLAR